MPAELIVGSLSPDFKLSANDGSEICLSDYRDKALVVLFFVREYIWVQCRSHVSQLGRLYKDFRAAGAEVLVILGDTPEHARQYAELLKLPFAVLADPGRVIYHLYDLERAIFGIQRTASVVVDQHGMIRYIKRATNPMLWLQESGELLKFVNGLGGTT
jgi:peroxiredoxin